LGARCSAASSNWAKFLMVILSPQGSAKRPWQVIPMT
jgi:hypothetical protein